MTEPVDQDTEQMKDETDKEWVEAWKKRAGSERKAEKVTMKPFQVVFKAGYEIDAENRDEAIKKAKEELRQEYADRGINLFVVDVTV